jgi:hypothetical protein
LILWLPCICAGFLTLGLARLEKAGIRKVARWFMTQHSVLAGDVPASDLSQAQNHTLMVTIPLGLCKQFLEVSLFVVALVMTAKLAGMILEEQTPDLNVALRGIAAGWREIFLFSLKYMVVLGAAGAIMILPASSALISYRLMEITASKAFVYPVALALTGGGAWLLMPTAIRFLRSPDTAPVSAEVRNRGTIFYVLTSAVALALENIIGRAEATMVFEKRWELAAVSAVNSIVVNTPEVLLFIALALLAFGGTRDPLTRENQDAPTLPSEQAAE